jgi:hypothetical protein
LILLIVPGTRIASAKAAALGAGGKVTLQVRDRTGEGHIKIETGNLFFDPVRYRPMAAQVIDLKTSVMSLDGA